MEEAGPEPLGNRDGEEQMAPICWWQEWQPEQRGPNLGGVGAGRGWGPEARTDTGTSSQARCPLSVVLARGLGEARCFSEPLETTRPGDRI